MLPNHSTKAIRHLGQGSTHELLSSASGSGLGENASYRTYKFTKLLYDRAAVRISMSEMPQGAFIVLPYYVIFINGKSRSRLGPDLCRKGD
jgi:hypothetical protein